jgi:hypothetical protein
LRYLAATLPRVPHLEATFERAPPWKRVSFASSDSSARRRRAGSGRQGPRRARCRRNVNCG